MCVSSASARLVTDPTPPEPAPAPAKGRRLAWLDALRGFAALCVVFDHMGTLVLQRLHNDVFQVIDTGQYGVFVFFLVSGYIIPASLERKGSVRGFWVSRGFRLYPLYILGIGISLLAWKTGFGPIHGANTQPKTWVYSLPFMMSNMLDGANVPNVIWTLSFEMVFYLLLSALFIFRVHRHSGGYAMAAAIGAVALGGILPLEGLTHTFGSRRVAIAADILLFIGLALAVSGRRVPRLVGGIIGAATGFTLLLFNTSYPYNWSGLTILALMFTGTMLYRAERGEFGKAKAAVIAAMVLALTIAAGVWHSLMWQMTGAEQVAVRPAVDQLPGAGRGDVRHRHAAPAPDGSPRAGLAGSGQLLGLHAAPDRAERLPVDRRVSPAAPVRHPGPAGRRHPGRRAGLLRAQLLLRRGAHAASRAPLRPAAPGAVRARRHHRRPPGAGRAGRGGR